MTQRCSGIALGKQWFRALIAVLIWVKVLSEKNLTTFPLTLPREQSGQFNFKLTTVLGILQQLDFFSLYFNHISDTDNRLVDFLIEQDESPVQIFNSLNDQLSLRPKRGVENVKHGFHASQRHFAVVVRATKLRSALERFALREGILICIILDRFQVDELLEVARANWQQRGIYKIYYFAPAQCWFYNPFARNEQKNSYGNLIDANQLLMSEIFNNFHGYPVRIYIFDSVYSNTDGDPISKTLTDISGADSEAAKLLSNKLNFTVELQWPDDEFFGARLGNGSYNGAIGRLVRYETDIVLTGFFVKDYLTRDIAFTVSVYMDELCCYTRKARRIPQSILPLFAVRQDIWVGFFLVGLLSSIVWMLFRFLNLSLDPGLNWLEQPSAFYRRTYQYVRIFVDTWVVWVRVDINCFPPFYSERIFVISLCLVSVIYGALFESSLATVYIRPLYYKDINSLQDLDNANLRIYIKHAAMKDDLFFGHSSLVYQNLNGKLLLVAETEERLITMMAKRGGFAAVTRASSLVLDDIRYLITNKIHKIPECPKNYHIAFVLPHHSPYEETFNIMLLRFMNAGLINQWIEVMKHRSRTKIHRFPDYKAETGSQWKVLTLKDLQLAFYTLLLGCILALFSLFGELLLRSKLKHFGDTLFSKSW